MTVDPADLEAACAAQELFGDDELEEFVKGYRCEACGSLEPVLLGVLGTTEHYRCRRCGWEYGREIGGKR